MFDNKSSISRQITAWLATSNIAPLTLLPLHTKTLIPNISLRGVIEAYKIKHPSMREEMERYKTDHPEHFPAPVVPDAAPPVSPPVSPLAAPLAVPPVSLPVLGITGAGASGGGGCGGADSQGEQNAVRFLWWAWIKRKALAWARAILKVVQGSGSGVKGLGLGVQRLGS